MSVLNKCFFGFSVLFLTSCAAVNSPEGGPKDEIKPTLQEISPANGTTNFQGHEIRLKFSEDIRLKDLNTQLIVTPNTGNVITSQTIGPELRLSFDKALDPNTTYLLNFREGIEDITEGNKAENVTLAFSTGANFDSSSVSGNVKNYLTNQPDKNVTIALYPATDTGNIRNQKPWYFTRTFENGDFRITNLKDGTYRIYAHADKNTNEIYDNDNERIGYIGDPITINGKLDSVQLKTVFLDTKKPFVITVEKNLDRNTIQYSEGIREISFKTLAAKPENIALQFIKDPNGKLIHVFPENGKLQASVLAFSVDSSNQAGIDTVKFELTGKAAYQGRFVLTSNKGINEISPEEKLRLLSPIPVKLLKPQPFTIIEDSVKITKLTEKEISLNENKTEIMLNHKITAKQTLRLETDTTAIAGVNGKLLNKTVIPFTIVKRSGLGSISGTVQTKFANYTVELLDAQYKILKTLNKPKSFKLEDLAAGNYIIRVKIDENNDGKWTAAHKDLVTQPEKIYFYPKPLDVRANWEIEDVVLNF